MKSDRITVSTEAKGSSHYGGHMGKKDVANSRALNSHKK